MARRRSARVEAPQSRATVRAIQIDVPAVSGAHSQRAVAKLGQPRIGHSTVIDAGGYEAVPIVWYMARPANKARVSV